MDRPRPRRAERHRGAVRRAVVLLGVLGLVLGACSSGSSASGGAPAGDVEVRPFSEVQDGPITFEADPTDPDRGIFRVTTTEPMICAIVWGETEALGNFNNSLAMNGTGITRHDVYLPGAVPGRTYTYVVQGTTADGTLYRSAPAPFTIPGDADASPPDTVDHGPDLAVGATVVAVSSEFGPEFAATNAVDGSGTTEWSSAGDGDDASITIDLGAAEDVSGVEFITRSMADGTAIARTFSVTVDGGSTYGPFPAGTAADPAFAAVATSGRTFRFDVDTSTGGNVGAVEVRVFGR